MRGTHAALLAVSLGLFASSAAAQTNTPPLGTEPGAAPVTPLGTEPTSASSTPALPSGVEPGGSGSTEVTEVRWGHRNQFALRAGVSMGYRLTIRYQDGGGTDPCNATDDKFCAQATPLMLDTAAGFGVSDQLELEGRFRFGLTQEFDNARPLQVGLGLRYLSANDRLRFFFAVAGFADLTSARPRASGDFDVIVRVEQGLHYDVNRYFGFYLSLGEGFSFLKNFSFVIDGTVGVQGRVP